jgi:hypothetical protein
MAFVIGPRFELGTAFAARRDNSALRPARNGGYGIAQNETIENRTRRP